MTQLNLNMQARDLERMGQIVEKPRGDLEKVLPREDLKPRVCLRNIPRHSDSPEGELFSDIIQGFSTICQTLVS